MEESIATADWDVDIHNVKMTCMTTIMEWAWGFGETAGRESVLKSVMLLALYIYIAGSKKPLALKGYN